MLLLISTRLVKTVIGWIIQIHRMLLLIVARDRGIPEQQVNSNTSYVAINLEVYQLKIVMLFHSNTSYVAINQAPANYVAFNSGLFKYIVCCY